MPIHPTRIHRSLGQWQTAMASCMLAMVLNLGVCYARDHVVVQMTADPTLRGGSVLVRTDGGRWMNRGPFTGDGDTVILALNHAYEVRIEKSDLWTVHWGFCGIARSELSDRMGIHIREEEHTLPNTENIAVAAASVALPMLGALWLRVRRKPAPDETDDSGAQSLEDFGFSDKLRSRRGVRLPESRIIGPYHVGDEVGEGAAAVVYKVSDAEGRWHAMKIPHWAACKEPDFVKRFQREIAICKKLQHPNIVSAYDSGSYTLEDGTRVPYFVMELTPGTPLNEYLTGENLAGNAPDLEVAVKVGRAVAKALLAAHERGIVHRDIKPSNVMLGFVIKVMDFGIARATDQFTALTRGAVGTPTYMAPEQISDFKAVDARADLYALGMLLFVLTTHTAPFSEDDPVAAVSRKLSERAPAVRDRNPNIPPALARIIDRLLERAPADRFQTAAELISALDAACA